jgi:peptidoglycan/LPS O-acetylase OafA/YrhL
MTDDPGTRLPPLVRDPRYRLLDVWRGVACLMVVLHHAGFAVVFDTGGSTGLDAWLRRGVAGILWRMNLGVSLFFVISGYCIGASVDATRRRGIGALAFLGRRVWRIYPPYWAAVAWFALVTGGLDALGLHRLHAGSHALELDSPGMLDVTQWVGNLTLTEEWRPLVWRPPPARVFTRIAWSLCYEEQFYFVCFLALLAAPRRLYGVVATITAGAMLVRVGAADIGRMHLIEGSFFTLWHEFAIGLAVYWRLNVARAPTAKRAIELGIAVLGAIGIAGGFKTPIPFSTAVAAGFGLVLIALRSWDERAFASRWLAPLRACGRRCYSIYLVHLPVCTVATLWLYERGITGFWPRVLIMIPVVSSAAVAVCWLFFWGVERHFLNSPIVSRDPRRIPPEVEPLAGEAPIPAVHQTP